MIRIKSYVARLNRPLRSSYRFWRTRENKRTIEIVAILTCVVGFASLFIAGQQTMILSKQTTILEEQHKASKANLVISIAERAYFFPMDEQSDDYKSSNHRIYVYATIINQSSSPVTIYELEIKGLNGEELGKTHSYTQPREEYVLKELPGNQREVLEINKENHLKPNIQFGPYEVKSGILFFLPPDNKPLPYNDTKVSIAVNSSRGVFVSNAVPLNSKPGITKSLK